MRPLNRIVRQLHASAKQTGNVRSRTGRDPWDTMYRQWSFRYSGFVRRRFNQLSRAGGGGGWAPYAKSTRRRRGRKDKASMLRDTSTMFGGLTVGAKGNITKRIKNGVRFGFGGNDRHPEGKLTIARLANIHHGGSRRRNIPARPIIVGPDGQTRRGMLQDARRAFLASAKG